MGTAMARRADPVEVAQLEERPAQEVNFGDLLALSKELVPTGFLPEHIKTPGQCAAVILTGRELGMGPMRALRSLQMVKGKVVENADSQLARFKADGGRALWKQLSDQVAELWLRHPNGDEHTETFTMKDAEVAGLTKPTYKGEPSMFLKYPRAMLRSRAITAALKSIGWEGGVGNYDPAEAAEFAPTVIVEPPMHGGSPAAAPNSPASDDTGEAPTDKQRQFFGRLMRSSVFTDDERDRAGRALEGATKAKLTDMIDRAKTELERRKALAEQQAKGNGQPSAETPSDAADVPPESEEVVL